MFSIKRVVKKITVDFYNRIFCGYWSIKFLRVWEYICNIMISGKVRYKIYRNDFSDIKEYELNINVRVLFAIIVIDMFFGDWNG